MKIQCQSCQAKYTIADEKVLGKVVKIRCKKCSATIVINGNDQAHAEDHADTNVFDYASNPNEQWTVNVADGDQRTMTINEIVTEYKAGVVNDETYCWKDGMADWLPLREIEQLYGATKLSPRPSLEDISIAPQSVPPAASPLFSGADVAGVLDSPFAPANGNGNGNGHGAGAALFGGGGAGMDAATSPVAGAARRGGGRGQGADLFGNVERAGGEEDVMTSAAAGAAAAAAAASPAAADKMTGQRNENSVLFSLNALTEKKDAPPVNRTTAANDGSGLIDIRALSANMSGDDKKDSNARVDDIMNLSGGGAFGAALAAPILAPPPLDPIDLGHGSTAESKSNKTLLVAILGGAFILAVGIIVAVVLTRPAVPTTATLPSALPGEASAAPTAMGSATVAMNDTPPPSEKGSTPPPPGTGGDTASKPATVNPGKPSTGAAKAGGGGGGGGGGAHESQPTPPPEPAKPASPPSLAEGMAAAASKPAAPAAPAGGGGSSAPFDRGAASAAVGAVNVQSCKKPDGPTGAGHVQITFGPDGSVQSAIIDSGPFPGTPVGGCIAGKFRGAHVPPFGGAPVKVGKSFTLN